MSRRTYGDAMREAVENEDAELAGRIADALRAKGYSYDEVVASFVRSTGVEARDVEALFLEAEALDAST